MQKLRAVAILFAFVISGALVMASQSLAVRWRLKLRKSLPRHYSKFLCALFGVRVTMIGAPLRDRGVLIVANHTSYLDMPILAGILHASFVAKSEVSGWFFFGTMARLMETVFVERARRSQTGEVRNQISERLRAGDALVLFPEGTSNDGNRVLTFKSALMGAVEAEIGVDAQGKVQYAPVQPVSMSYVGFHGMPMGRENRPLYAWYGDMELVPHLWEALQAGPIDVIVEFHPPMDVDSAGGRKALAAQAEQIIRRGQSRALAGLAQPDSPALRPETMPETTSKTAAALS